MISTALTRRFALATPVVGAPMAGVAGGALARAVSLGGGLGMIGVGSATPTSFVVEQCAVPRGDGLPFGVGLMAWALPGRPDLLEATIQAAPDLVSVSFGDPAPWVPRLHDAGIAVASQVNTVADLHRALAAGVDLVVAQGSEAGGHTGQRATLPLLQEVLALTDRPVLAAGGVATGAGMAAALAAGAAGVWIGTPLLSCPEGLNSPAARERVRAAAGEETVLTRAFDVAQGIPWPERWPGRALVNDFSRTWHGREAELAHDAGARQLVVDGRRTGDPASAPVYAGESVGLVTAERSATEVVRELDAAAEQALRAVAGLLDRPPAP
ncbi:nitronate monooxygenase [Blastococcus sp. MG754426]|uniref:NAD(P)H-dependent flavin oxidoreductase n=1 Tax=unclassified Blastococcus TaxID=2619396 RepID=UPI001EF0EEA2|nr:MULTISPECIES: nitronate monooxygenase [unclassified Blastococcus]MCF6508390.1 nitronate monooxygenase [Blastococcus sp. MG754426]MCF6513006.1 nitronate monooxygenase [Blastococcus sp. MG754427]MCF6735760.1 nitronate monooxygenase [Blastococcus sp. KM273129]